MIAVNREIMDFVHLGFQFISHKLLVHSTWVLVGMYTHESSNNWPKFSSNGHCLTIQTNHIPKLLYSEIFSVPKLIKHLSTLMLYSTNAQTTFRHRSTPSEEWARQVLWRSNHVWASNHRLKDNRFGAMKSRQISCSSFSLHHTLWSVFRTL